MDTTLLSNVQGELERLFDLDGMLRLTEGALGFDPHEVGATDSPGTFARALVQYCYVQEALPALVDAMIYAGQGADRGLRGSIKNLSNGELAPGTRVGELQVVKKIGEGGLSMVYLAELHSEGGAPPRQAALKVIRPEFARDPAAVHRFTTAARFQQQISSEGLAPIVGVGRLADRRPWVAAQYMAGQTLAERIKRNGALHINEALPLLRGVLDGLAALHARGIVHGDIKVENVFVQRAEGERDPVGVLVDAGADRLLSRGVSSAGLTGLLPVIGTPKAIAPEQARGAEPDERSDIYAVGTLIYEVLTGRPPFDGASAIDVIAGHLAELPEPPSLHARKGWVSEALDEVVLRALSKDADARHPGALALLEALEDAVRRPARIVPFDELTFTDRCVALAQNPGDTSLCDELEALARASDVWPRAAEAFTDLAGGTDDEEAALQLLRRAARIYHRELREPLLAEAAYQRVLERCEQDAAALAGIEAVRRAHGDYPGLIDVLLERIEREDTDEGRLSVLKEVADIYESHLDDSGNAAVAWLQVLITEPSDDQAQRAIVRLCRGHEGRWQEVMETISSGAAELAVGLEQPDESAQRVAAGEALEAVEERLRQAQREIDEAIAERSAAATEARDAEVAAKRRDREAYAAAQAAERQALMQQRSDAEQALKQAESEEQALETALVELDKSAGELQERLDALEAARDEADSALTEKSDLLDVTRNEAQSKLAAYEALEAEAGDEPSDEQAERMGALADEAEALIERADELEEQLASSTEALEKAKGELEDARAQCAAIDARRDEFSGTRGEVRERVLVAAEILQGLPAVEEIPEVDERELESDEPLAPIELEIEPHEEAHLATLRAEMVDAKAAFDALAPENAEQRAAERARERADLIALHNLQGRWYEQQLRRPDLAAPCFGAVLELDPANDGAHAGLVQVYRSTGAWPELCEALLRRAQVAASPVKARDHRAEAGLVIAEHLGDVERAEQLFREVLEEDPAHRTAQDALAGLLSDREDYEGLAELLEQRVAGQMASEAAETRVVLAQLYEGQLGDFDHAKKHFKAAVEEDEGNLDALRGLERISEHAEDYETLLAILLTQVDHASTPKQRIALLERVGSLQEEEFVDLPAAAGSFEGIVAIDPGNAIANDALARLYRQLSRFDDLVDTLERRAGSVPDPDAKVALLVQAERVLAVELDSPERALSMCERILAIDDRHVGALAEFARLKSSQGDTAEAVRALHQLAEQESDPAVAAKHLVKAAQMLTDDDQRDEAIALFRRALDVDTHCTDAADALRALYQERGDTHGTIEMLKQSIAVAEGDLKRAQLYTDLGLIYLERFEDYDQAAGAFSAALELEASNAPAAAGLGRIALREEQHETAAEYFGIAMGRLDDLDPVEAASVCIMAGETYSELGEDGKSLEAFKRARQLDPESVQVVERCAEALAHAGQHKEAEGLYASLLRRLGGELEGGERLRLMRARAAAQLAASEAAGAVSTLGEALSLAPEDPELLSMLTRAHALAENWNEVVNLLQQRTALAETDDDRFPLLVETADVFLEHVNDRDAAAQTYVMALDVQPNSRNLLTKLMGVYSDMRDWPRLIEVLLRIAEMVDEPAQLAKYYTTAGTIAKEELGRFDEAANYYEEAIAALSVQDSVEQFDDLVDCLTQNQDWERLERAYETRIARLHDDGASGDALGALMDRRAEVLRDHLGRTAEAMHLFEEAQRVDPENRARREMLTAVYTREPKRFFQQAVLSHRALLDEEPLRVESLQALRKVYTSGKKPDESWCLCQLLRCLQVADVDEEKFFKKYRLNRLVKVKHALDERAWQELLVHPAQDGIVTAIFATLGPAIAAVQGQALSAFGVDEHDRVDPATDGTAMGRMIYHAGEAMGFRPPDVYYARQDTGGLSFLFANPPAIGIGQGAMAGGPPQALAFVAARHLSYFRPGHQARQLVPTGTGLRAWLMAAIRLASPNLPIAPSMQAQVGECQQAIQNQLVGPQRETLRSLAQKLLDAAPELDMKRWMAGIDLTADRLGLALSNDLKIACAVIEASPDESSVVPRDERTSSLMVYSVSDEYFELRKRLGIALGG